MRAHSRTRSMRARRITAATAVLSAVLLTTLLAPAQAWDNRTVNLDNNRLQLGEEVEVSGGGYPVGETVDIKVCGVPDVSGLLSCNPVAQDVLVASNGTVKETVTVRKPTGACPCSIVIAAVNAPPVAERIELLGHQMASQARAPELIVDAAELTAGSLLGLFGAPTKGTLELTLRNAGVAPASPTLQLSWTEGDGEPVAITDPEVPQIAPGQTQSVKVPVDFDGFSQGEYEISGHAVVGDLYAPVAASAKVVPWGLYGLLLVVVGGIVLRRVRVANGAAGSDGTSGDADVDDTADLIARATGSAAPERTVGAPGGRTAVPSAPYADEELVGPPRLESTPIVRREGLEALGEAPLPVAPPAPLPAPTHPVPPAPSLDAAVYMQAYLETNAPQPRPGPLTASLEAVGALSGGQPVPAAPAVTWEDAEPIAEVAPAPYDPTPVTPGRGISVAERLAQAAEKKAGVSGAEHASGPRTTGIPAVGGPTAGSGADIVARALETIKEHSSDSPSHLPDKDEYVVPEQRGRRAPKGGRRAARPERDGWLSRR